MYAARAIASASVTLSLISCSAHSVTNMGLPQTNLKHFSKDTTSPKPVAIRLSDGEVVTIQPGTEPPIFLPSQIPSAILTAVRNHQDLSIGAFHAVVEVDDTSWTAEVPPPSGGNNVELIVAPPMHQSPQAHIKSTTGSSPDHSTDGWHVDGYDSNPNYQSEGYVQFDSDMGLPTLYPGQAGGPGQYMYYAPTAQGTDGNPLEVGLATAPNWPAAGPQHLFIYDWANPNGNSPCAQTGYPSCKGWAPYAPTINSTFTSKYVRVLSHGVPEWSVVTVQSGSYWYFGIYNHSTSQWEYPYYEPYTEIRHNFTTGLNGLGGGHGYFEYYLPPNTNCAGADPSYPTSANTYETDAQQYSATSKTWTRISVEKFMYPGLSGLGGCFSGPNTPYFSLSDFGDGWSDWEAAWE